jgi:hypothetical protein
MITISVDTSGLERMGQRLGKIDLKPAIARALNRAGNHMTIVVVRQLAGQTGLGVREVRDEVHIDKAFAGHPGALADIGTLRAATGTGRHLRAAMGLPARVPACVPGAVGTVHQGDAGGGCRCDRCSDHRWHASSSVATWSGWPCKRHMKLGRRTSSTKWTSRCAASASGRCLMVVRVKKT